MLLARNSTTLSTERQRVVLEPPPTLIAVTHTCCAFGAAGTVTS
jgi:hypothetical protein